MWLRLAGNHTHLTDDAIIHHHNNDPDYSAVSRYPPYVKKNGTQVVNQPFPSENKNIEASQGIILLLNMIFL